MSYASEKFKEWGRLQGVEVTEEDAEACQKFAAISLAYVALGPLDSAQEERGELTSAVDELKKAVEDLTLTLQPWLSQVDNTKVVGAFVCAPHDEASSQKGLLAGIFFEDIFPKILGPERSEAIGDLYDQNKRQARVG